MHDLNNTRYHFKNLKILFYELPVAFYKWKFKIINLRVEDDNVYGLRSCLLQVKYLWGRFCELPSSNFKGVSLDKLYENDILIKYTRIIIHTSWNFLLVTFSFCRIPITDSWDSITVDNESNMLDVSTSMFILLRCKEHYSKS